MATFFENFHRKVKELADQENLSTREFACTALLAAVSDDAAAFAQLGDGAIVISQRSDPGDCGWVFWPDRGEYENQTSFITDADSLDRFHFETTKASIDDLAVFTDGLQRLALHFSTLTAHLPFFLPLFQLVRVGDLGPRSDIKTWIETFLCSERVLQRTDDDKTLILASRRSLLENDSSHGSPSSGD